MPTVVPFCFFSSALQGGLHEIEVIRLPPGVWKEVDRGVANRGVHEFKMKENEKAKKR